MMEFIGRGEPTLLLKMLHYHPQTDGQSERTNQTVEIALRYFHIMHPGEDWTLAIPFIQGMINNPKSTTTNFLPNELCYGTNVKDTLDLLGTLPTQDYDLLRS